MVAGIATAASTLAASKRNSRLKKINIPSIRSSVVNKNVLAVYTADMLMLDGCVHLRAVAIKHKMIS